MSDRIVIVDQDDQVVGAAPRDEAFAQRLTFRIVRVFLFNPAGELFLQQRGPKVDGPNLWDQSVGGHVDEGEDYDSAVRRETAEELGLRGLSLKPLLTYPDQAERPDGIGVKRFNRIYTATTDQEPVCNPDEIAIGKWIELSQLRPWMSEQPQQFTQGFRTALAKYDEVTGG